MKTLAVLIVLGGLVLAVLILTPYRYDHTETLNQSIQTRTHRLTGKTEILSLSRGWIPVTDFILGDLYGEQQDQQATAPATQAPVAQTPTETSPRNDVTPERQQTIGRLGRTVPPSSNIYRQCDPRSPILNRIPSGTYFAVKGQQEDYYAVLMIDSSIGWIPKTSVDLLDYDVVADPQQPGRSPSNPGVNGLAAAVLQEAYRYLGVPYHWSGNDIRGTDGSGWVRNVFARCGILLPRTAQEQARVGAAVAFSDIRAGDRLYFAVKHRAIDHTGIYLGNGYFIHASITHGDVGVDRLTEPLYGSHLVDARRIP